MSKYEEVVNARAGWYPLLEDEDVGIPEGLEERTKDIAMAILTLLNPLSAFEQHLIIAMVMKGFVVQTDNEEFVEKQLLNAYHSFPADGLENQDNDE